MPIRYAVLIAALSIAGSLPARAHDHWADNRPVPPWVKAQCCGPADAHHLEPSEVHVTPAGYRVDGYRDTIPEARLSPSPDGEWWIFYRTFTSGEQSQVYCFFGPPQGS